MEAELLADVSQELGKRTGHGGIKTRACWGGPQASIRRVREPPSGALPSPESAKLIPQFITSFCRSGEDEIHILYCSSTLLLPAVVKALN